MAQNILDSLRDKGVLSSSAQEKLLNLIPDNTKEKLFNIFQRYQELNDEEKQQFVHEVVGKFKQVLEDKMNNYSSLYTYLFHSYLIFIFAVLFVVFILVFFVYKLFKCLSDRQTKREEKKKTKQMKKKK
ncbi:uncharacterized protein LOC107998810 isoform X2 [Apis cerana]|uniref:uncharacterized protein LOC107998810 isoform X2 n=1 Tax=Apis cerana TaxID=7461 RepID=UPI0007E2AB50|nr:uncharacterized protein LOC107998810 isoform X2 [Apis cerana]